MTAADQAIVLVYLGVTLRIGLRQRAGGGAEPASSFLLAGRRLTLPAFVATMVSTWYGGILGVGEYSFRFGLSSWLVFGAPYYLAAGIFALLLAGRARRARVLTLPEQLRRAYGRGPASIGAAVVLATTLPAAYLLTLGVLLRLTFGLPLWLGVLLAALFSLGYLWRGGFQAVVRTDALQFGMMFLGLAVLVGVLVARHGLFPFLAERVPASHWTWHGGNAPQTIVVWYFIALSTLVEPTFYQRCFAAKSPEVARRGLLLSIVLWCVFDALTTVSGLYARALLTDLPATRAAEAFPLLATAVLPPGLVGVFFVALFCTVMSTVDSYLFLAGSTVGRDLLGRAPAWLRREPTATRLGLVVAAAAASGLALTSSSVVKLWHALGTVGACTLLLPVLGAFLPRLRPSRRGATWMMVVSLTVSLLWLFSRHVLPDGGYLLGVEPIYPGLGVAALIWIVDRLTRPSAKAE